MNLRQSAYGGCVFFWDPLFFGWFSREAKGKTAILGFPHLRAHLSKLQMDLIRGLGRNPWFW